jgi:hypothetical protein
MKKCVLFLVLLLMSCATNSKNMDINYKILYSGQNGITDEVDYILIKNNQDYIEYIKKLNVEEDSYNELLDIDFSKNNICILLLGQRNTGGYSITVESLKWNKSILYIKKKEISPAKGEMVTNALTNPYCIVVIPKAKEIIVK